MGLHLQNIVAAKKNKHKCFRKARLIIMVLSLVAILLQQIHVILTSVTVTNVVYDDNTMDLPKEPIQDQRYLPQEYTPQPVEINITNILWSRNWHHFANCPDAPDRYYTLEGVAKWCPYKFTTECNHLAEDMVKWFQSCKGTIWIRSQSQKDGGDLYTFISRVLPLIHKPFVLITTDGDNSNPRHVRHYQKLISNQYLQTWYTQNYDGYPDPRIHPLPIGLDLHSLRNGDTAHNVLEKMKAVRNGNSTRSSALYIAPMVSQTFDFLISRLVFELWTKAVGKLTYVEHVHSICC